MKSLSTFSKLEKMIVVILGSTGVGKTKVAIDLAKRIDGEIVNADSMQIYSALPIATNQPSLEEMSSCAHHLFSFVDSKNTDFTVRNYRDYAVSCIDEILSRAKLPIITGGTNYYIESVLWNNLIDDSEDHIDRTSDNSYERLCIVDPQTAAKMHPNDERHIKRALEVFDRTGLSIQDVFKEQHNISGSFRRGTLRYDNAVIIWLDCDRQELEKRVKARTVQMINNGMLKELKEFHKCTDNIKYDNGIFQCIGLKEFVPYLETDENTESSKVLNECIDIFVSRTLRYSRTQKKWIKRRLLTSDGTKPLSLYRFDCSTIDVSENVIELIQCIRENVSVSIECERLSTAQNIEFERNICHICDKVFTVKTQWLDHMSSKRHKKRMSTYNKKCLATLK